MQQTFKLVTLSAPVTVVGALYNQAKILGDDGDFQGMAEVLEGIMEIDPSFTYAQNSLGQLYASNKIEVEGNLEKAFELFRSAARQGDAVAQYNLGVCYTKGQGVAQDFERARLIFSNIVENEDLRSAGLFYLKEQVLEEIELRLHQELRGSFRTAASFGKIGRTLDLINISLLEANAIATARPTGQRLRGWNTQAKVRLPVVEGDNGLNVSNSLYVRDDLIYELSCRLNAEMRHAFSTAADFGNIGRILDITNRNLVDAGIIKPAQQPVIKP